MAFYLKKRTALQVMQPKPKNWGDIMKLHSEIQKQREDVEIQLEKEKKARFKYY